MGGKQTASLPSLPQTTRGARGMRLTQRKRRRVDTNFDRAFDVNLSLCEHLQQPLSAEDPDSTPAAAGWRFSAVPTVPPDTPAAEEEQLRRRRRK